MPRKGRFKTLAIGSYADLLDQEQEILRRIEDVPNGGNLFLIHPFLLLGDVGVKLSEEAVAEIRAAEPNLVGLSPVPYAALKASRSRQHYRVHLKGLFARRTS